jgi:signal transduction histidine kinase
MFKKSKTEAVKRTRSLFAHEIATPLAEVFINLYALSRILPKEYANYLTSMQNSVEHMQALIEAVGEIEVLEELVKGDSLKFNIDSPSELKDVSVNALLQIAIMAIKETREEYVKFSINYSRGANIKCNPREIIQVVMNLLRNSFDTFDKRVGNINIKSSYTKDFVQVVIQDDGGGISEDIKDKIFDEGFSTRNGAGRGYGLSVAKSLVSKNKSTLKIDNDVVNGKISGCIVIIEFPKSRY